ncbi:MAG: 50S ribosomal protein L2 [Thermoplasmata archaeon]|nr:MAG: 50S ribosomal protein L2 [Thermoplasmata archaeon]
MGKRLKTQRRGRGSIYRSPSHRHRVGRGGIRYLKSKTAIKGQVKDLQHDPGRSAPVAKVVTDDGVKTWVIANEGMRVEQEVLYGTDVPNASGNVLPISEIPEGTKIFNIESQPGDGGKFVRAGGTYATVVSHGVKTVIQLPSGQFKPLDPDCKATIGVVAGGGRKDKPMIKAGKHWYATRSRAKKFPTVSGVAMNPVNHPHGGGAHQHVGKPSTVSRHAPPGRKVGRLSPKRKSKKKRK